MGVTMFGISLSYYLVALSSSFICYFFMKHRKALPVEFMKYIFRDKKETTAKNIGDILLFSFAGGFLGTLLVSPQTVQQAIVAGMAWMGVVSMFAKSTEKQ